MENEGNLASLLITSSINHIYNHKTNLGAPIKSSDFTQDWSLSFTGRYYWYNVYVLSKGIE